MVIHNHEIDLPPPGQLHAVQSIEVRQQCVRVVLHVHVVVFQDGEEEFVPRVLDGFDDEAVIAGEVEGARFAWGAEFGEDVFEGEGEEVVCGFQVEVIFVQIAEYPGGVVIEFEIIFS